jgi:hypothetical protein
LQNPFFKLRGFADDPEKPGKRQQLNQSAFCVNPLSLPVLGYAQ